jgi:glycoprotein 3-alpha-L-fucosyltransferase
MRRKNAIYQMLILFLIVIALWTFFKSSKNMNAKIYIKFGENLSKTQVEESKLLILAQNDQDKYANLIDYQRKYSILAKNNDSFQYKTIQINKRPLSQINKSKYRIVEYTKVFFAPKFCSKSNYDIFNSESFQCPFNNCEWSCDLSSNSVKTADALLFHERDLEVEFYRSNNIKQWLAQTQQLPSKKVEDKMNINKDQIWILWNDEATKVPTQFSSISSLFNWTISYHSRAEIYLSTYGFLAPFYPKSINSNSNILMLNEFRERYNAVLWFVSNCNAEERINFVLEFSKHYPVYIYTTCEGTIRNKINTNEHKYLKLVSNYQLSCSRDSPCELEHLNSFKYYFGLESRNCSDYITEKLWRSLYYKIIPIVNQPSRESYSHFNIPPEAIIHLEDFNFDAKKLASHLKTVDSNFMMYKNYLKWIYDYTDVFFKPKDIEPRRFCDLCQKLNEEKNLIYYNNIDDFFNKC